MHPIENAEKCGLPASRRPDQCGHLSRLHAERHSLEHLLGPEPGADIGGPEPRPAGRILNVLRGSIGNPWLLPPLARNLLHCCHAPNSRLLSRRLRRVPTSRSTAPTPIHAPRCDEPVKASPPPEVSVAAVAAPVEPASALVEVEPATVVL